MAVPLASVQRINGSFIFRYFNTGAVTNASFSSVKDFSHFSFRLNLASFASSALNGKAIFEKFFTKHR